MINGTSTITIWIVNGLLAVSLGVVGFTGNREYKRNDEQEIRIRALEQAIVRIDYMADDIVEIRDDLKTLMRQGK